MELLEENRTQNRATYQAPSFPSYYCLLHAWIWVPGLQRKESFQLVSILLAWTEQGSGDRLRMYSLLGETEQ